jgi:F-type H+-transporting ATPase subunit gamma
LIQGYLDKEWDEVIVFSTHFRSALTQDVVTRRVLPVAAEALKQVANEIVPEHGRFAELIKDRSVTFFNRDPRILKEYLIEPSSEVILDALARHLVEAELYQLILEANASEWAARRMAMKSASDNAYDLAQRYTLQYNKSRQASITREIIEITAGAESMQ